jgi:hypothetical protein
MARRHGRTTCCAGTVSPFYPCHPVGRSGRTTGVSLETSPLTHAATGTWSPYSTVRALRALFVRSASKATKVLRCREPTRWAKSCLATTFRSRDILSWVHQRLLFQARSYILPTNLAASIVKDKVPLHRILKEFR